MCKQKTRYETFTLLKLYNYEFYKKSYEKLYSLLIIHIFFSDYPELYMFWLSFSEGVQSCSLSYDYSTLAQSVFKIKTKHIINFWKFKKKSQLLHLLTSIKDFYLGSRSIKTPGQTIMTLFWISVLKYKPSVSTQRCVWQDVARWNHGFEVKFTQ